MRAALEPVLKEAVRGGVTPGAVAAWRSENQSVREDVCAVGQLLPAGAAVQTNTLYDLASLTKPIVAMTALRLVMHSRLDLRAPASSYLPELRETHGGRATLEDLLSHRAGLSAWGSLFQELNVEPASEAARRDMLSEAARRIDTNAPALGSVYSDLGYLIAGEVIARAGGASLHEVVTRELLEPLGLDQRLFFMASRAAEERARLLSRVAPTEVCAFRGGLVHGVVHDENCFAFGGVAGHAGLFGEAEAVRDFGVAVLSSLCDASPFLDAALLKAALRPRSGGGYVLGWDTRSREGSSAGNRMGANAFGHLGFTGTSLWCDPDRRLVAVLLTNRVHPTRDNIAIRALRPRFHDALIDALDA